MDHRLRINNHLCDLRSLLYLIEGNDFEEAFASATPEGQKSIQLILERCQSVNIQERATARKNLQAWMRQHSQAEVTIRELRDIAAKFGVPYYSNLSKLQLLREISKVKYEKRDTVKAR